MDALLLKADWNKEWIFQGKFTNIMACNRKSQKLSNTKGWKSQGPSLHIQSLTKTFCKMLAKNQSQVLQMTRNPADYLNLGKAWFPSPVHFSANFMPFLKDSSENFLWQGSSSFGFSNQEQSLGLCERSIISCTQCKYIHRIGAWWTSWHSIPPVLPSSYGECPPSSQPQLGYEQTRDTSLQLWFDHLGSLWRLVQVILTYWLKFLVATTKILWENLDASLVLGADIHHQPIIFFPLETEITIWQ